MFETLELRIADDDKTSAERRRREEEFRRKEERRMELAQIRRIDDARYQRALEETKAWQGALQLANYAEALRSRIPGLEPSERERIEAWCHWLDERARRSNPVQTTSQIVGLNDERDGRGW